MLETDAQSREYSAILHDVAAAFDLHHIVDWQPMWLSDLASSIAEYHLAPTYATELAWRPTRPLRSEREGNSMQWWREAAAYRPSDDRARRVFEQLTGA